jgi:hypothetical protein
MATFTYKTKNPNNGFIEDNMIQVTEEDLIYTNIDDFIDEIDFNIKSMLKEEDNTQDRNELLQEFKENFETIIETKTCSSENIIGFVLRRKLNGFKREFNLAFPFRDTFQHVLDNMKEKFKPVELFCWRVIKYKNIPFIIENKDAVLAWFDEHMNITPEKLKERQCNAMLKWGKQMVTCSCGKEYPLYNKHHHIITKHHLNHINGITEEQKEEVVQENVIMGCILRGFILTNDKNDYTTSENIQKWIEDNNMNISMIKFGKEITEYCTTNDLKNIIKKDKKINGKATKVWFGIRSLSR